jgi:hypothetical protein
VFCVAKDRTASFMRGVEGLNMSVSERPQYAEPH